MNSDGNIYLTFGYQFSHLDVFLKDLMPRGNCLKDDIYIYIHYIYYSCVFSGDPGW